MFPQGGAGAGLVLLRVALVLLVVAWQPPAWTGIPPPWAACIKGLLVLGLVLGRYSSALAALCALAGLLALLPPQPQAWPWAPLLVVDGVALGLLGPGAYALDARRYGRRQLTLRSTRRRMR